MASPAGDSYFDIAFIPEENAGVGRITFLRDGIIVPEVKYGKARGVRALVVADDGPIASLLRDAEHPAHTHWSKDTSNFKDKYHNGPSYLTFVQNSVAKLMEIIRVEDADEDPTLLVDFFALPSAPEDDEDTRNSRKKKKKKKAEEPEPKPEPPPGKPKRYRINKIDGGFTISPGDADAVPPKALRIRVAYDRRSKDAFKRWHPADFRLDRAPITIGPDTDGIEIGELTDNRMFVGITKQDFRLAVLGFDTKRDLIVDVRPMEDSND